MLARMTTLLIIAALGGIAWYFISGMHRNHVQDITAMNPHDLLFAYADLKRSILVTSVYDKEMRYRQLYDRMKGIMRIILQRHAHFVLDPIASGTLTRLQFATTHMGAEDRGRRPYLYLPEDAEKRMSSDAVLAAAILLWHGNYYAPHFGEMLTDSKATRKLIEYLITDRNYAPALLFKGMMAKYGDEVYTEIRWREAHDYLTEARKRGIGSVDIEMEAMVEFKSLDGIKGVHSN